MIDETTRLNMNEARDTYIILKSQEIVNFILEDLKKKVGGRRYDKLNMGVRDLLK